MSKFIRSLPVPTNDAARRRSAANNQLHSGFRDPGMYSDPKLQNLNFSSLQDILYKGRGDRLQRYAIYDVMDMDADVSRALDIIAEHSTQQCMRTNTPFELKFEKEEMSYLDVELLYDMLHGWSKLNDWDKLFFRTFRNTVKYGDAFFIRDENYKLVPVQAKQVVGAHVNEQTSEIIGYLITGLTRRYDFMIETTGGAEAAQANSYLRTNYGTQQLRNNNLTAVFPAQHILHLSLNPGRDVGGSGSNDDVWPFGISYLEQVYRDYKQRAMMEEAEVIHRIQRAPTRRVFYIDTGQMREDRARAEIRRVRNEIYSRLIPTREGGGDVQNNIYNPISQLDDLFLSRGPKDAGTKVETLDGQAWSNDGALKYFTSKLLRGLRVPTSYMMGQEEGGSQYNDGRMGTAYMEEFHFSKICERLQNLIDNELDFEFKMYVRKRDVNVNAGLYDLRLVPPMNFDEYKDSSLLQERLGVMASANGIAGLSMRFKFRKYLGLSEDELLENEQLWLEENRSSVARQYAQDNNLGGMGAGMSGGFGGQADMFGSGMGGLGGMDGGMGGLDNGMGGLDNGMGGAGGAGGMGGAGGAGGPSMGMESIMKKRDKRGQVLIEMQRLAQYGVILTDAQKRALMEGMDEESTPSRKVDMNKPPEIGRKDELIGIGPEDDDETPILPLSHVRRMRIERELNREEMVKRLQLIPVIYAAQSDGGGMF